ncbi:MAG: Asp-tRNA(Asn)/Glu-tRNA(Gln) amidotransferase subunit GatC [Candidatus Pacebacteria bacterium]|nr:Asp-tRNA(Asn)/Glu-tRNA(Gln) amidotransferase subunit GatC [Candidatus Paceibacterota bacterium]
MDIKDIEKLALLARIELSEEEKQKMVKEMDSILVFIDQIQKADVNITEREAGEVRNIMREDGEPHESGIYTEDILREAPKTREGYVEVKKIL